MATALSISRRAVRKRAEKERWSYKEGINNVKLFWFSFLPEDIKLAISSYQQKQQALVPVLHPSTHTPALPDPGSRGLPSGHRLDKGMAKADLLRLYTQHISKSQHGGKVRARKEFMRAYNTGLAYPEIFELVGKVNWKTVEGWKRVIKKTGETFSLCDCRGFCERGKSSITDDEKNILLACALHSNQLLISEVVRSARDIMDVKGICNFLSDSTYTRYLNGWKSRNYHVWTFQREGKKAWNDKCCIDIERNPDSIAVGDVLVADGHTLNFEILNPWTGKPKRMTLILWYDMRSNFPLGWEIMPTEDTAAISSALRRAIIRLGKIPKIVYLDNGKAFRGKYFTQTDDFTQTGLVGLYERLGCQPVFAWAYHGQSKTIERFFGTMSEMERRTITYTGTSIEKKPPRMKRGEHLHREAYEKITQGGCITLEQAHISIATWFDKYINRKQKGKWLKNKTPLDLFLPGKGPGVDPYALRHLMLSIVIKRINKNGISLLGQNYYSHELYGRNHQAIVRFDLQDKTFVEVSDENDELICIAPPKKQAHAMARLGTEEDRNELAGQIKYKRHQEKLAGASTREFLEDIVLPEHKIQIANIADKSQSSKPDAQSVIRIPHLSDDAKRLEKEMAATLLKQSEEKAEKEKATQERIAEGMKQYHESLGKTIRRQDIDPDVVIEHEPILDDSPEIWKVLPEIPEGHRYEKLVEFEVRGWAVPKQWQAFMSYFEQTQEYLDRIDYYEEHRGRVVAMFQDDLTQRRKGAND
jgi:putative transposase